MMKAPTDVSVRTKRCPNLFVLVLIQKFKNFHSAFTVCSICLPALPGYLSEGGSKAKRCWCIPCEAVVLIHWALFLCEGLESLHDNRDPIEDNALDHSLAHAPDKRLSLSRGLVRSHGSQMSV